MRPGGRFFVRRVWGWLLNIQLGHRHLDWRCSLSSKTTKLTATLDASKWNLSWATLSSKSCKSTSWKRRCLRCKLHELHMCIYSINPAPPEMQINLKETQLFVHNCHKSHILCGKSVQNSIDFAIFVRNGRWGRTTSATYDYVTDLISNKQKVNGAQVELWMASVCVHVAAFQ